jgi:hypothetical protein
MVCNVCGGEMAVEGTAFKKTFWRCPRCNRMCLGKSVENKYRNERVEVEGHKFDSKREAARWMELRMLERTGAIRNLARQIRFPLDVNGIHICDYIADFIYESVDDSSWERVVEDSKGVRTPEYKLKAKLMLAIHGVTIKES